MIRKPVVAGQFYPGSAAELDREVRSMLAKAAPREAQPTILAMVPHAGYVYSGEVAGRTLGQANLADNLLLLGPNHTGLGAPLAVWNRGEWLTPLCSLEIDEALADALIESDARLSADQDAHVGEHSLEVMVPFLCALKPRPRAVPVAVSAQRLSDLAGVARNMASVIKALPEPVSIVVSSDMSHYVPADRARDLDSLALSAIRQMDPVGLYSTVREMGISMCGVLPMTLGLMIALELGASKAEVAAYANSGDVSGDFDRVVGYAGVLVS